MDVYEKAILLAAIPPLAVFGWFWKTVPSTVHRGGVINLFAVSQYQGNLRRMEGFFLKYLIPARPPSWWMRAVRAVATLATGRVAGAFRNSPMKTGSSLTWSAIAGFIGLMVRWYEST
jgi:hypothetical protein